MIIENEDDFAAYVDDESDHSFFYQIPCGLADTLNSFEKILFIRCLKPEKVLFAV